MKIAIDISPISDSQASGHKVRGAGMYVDGLVNGLKNLKKDNTYTFFETGEKIADGVDIVHYPYFEPFFRSLPNNSILKRVVTVHDLIPLLFPEHFPSGLRGKISWFFQKRALKSVQAIITDSNCSKKDITRITRVNPDKIHVVYLAVNKKFRKIENEEYKEKIKNKYNLPEKFILYVGDITWNKNLPKLVSAVLDINVPLVMVGKSIVQKDFDRSNLWNKDRVIVESLVFSSHKIIRLGYLPLEELVVLYNLATVLAMPSLYEGFGLPILEAMKCGCPVVCSSSGSIKEVAGDAAYYVDPNNRESIKSGLEKIFNSKLLQEKLQKKGMLQAKKFSWNKTIAQTIEVYKRIFNER